MDVRFLVRLVLPSSAADMHGYLICDFVSSFPCVRVCRDFVMGPNYGQNRQTCMNYLYTQQLIHMYSFMTA